MLPCAASAMAKCTRLSRRTISTLTDMTRTLYCISEQADKQTSEPATDMVNHPPHYCTGDIECWDAMVSAFGPEWMRAYATVTAFKYIWRAKHKGRFAEDMKKAAWYEARAAELEEKLNG